MDSTKESRTGGSRSESVRKRARFGLTPRFTSYLFVAALICISSFWVYNYYLVVRLREDTRADLDIYAKLYAFAVSDSASDREYTFIFNEVISKTRFPMIITDATGRPVHWQEISGVPPRIDFFSLSEPTREKLRETHRKMDRLNPPIPLEVSGMVLNYLHYSDPGIVSHLAWRPVLEVGTVLLFFVVGYIGFRNIKNSEQRSIWVGMAKETAHQLGTPLSSLFGWIELLRSEVGKYPGRERRKIIHRSEYVLGEMENDMRRLNKVASRFSQIGSVPELKREDVREVISDAIVYFQRRTPQFGQEIKVQETYGEVPDVPMNRELLGWVFENLFKNAIDALDRSDGRIEISVLREDKGESVIVEFGDNGRGIDAKDHKKIFAPGYSTKKRGWGLGLT